ncbi:hypothetical protein STRDD11_02737 [Streptococcus sp. DD11]|nr:hypothetical protein STRDD11_02737 [Streptococcus sp. DD11]
MYLRFHNFSLHFHFFSYIFVRRELVKIFLKKWIKEGIIVL